MPNVSFSDPGFIMLEVNATAGGTLLVDPISAINSTVPQVLKYDDGQWNTVDVSISGSRRPFKIQVPQSGKVVFRTYWRVNKTEIRDTVWHCAVKNATCAGISQANQSTIIVHAQRGTIIQLSSEDGRGNDRDWDDLIVGITCS